MASPTPAPAAAALPRTTVAALLALTFGTGVVDAVSYLGLGHVFVANMTGNIVFLGFAANRASGLSAVMALIALAGFLIGALVGGAGGHRFAGSPGWPAAVFAAQGAVLGGTAAVCAGAVVDRAWVIAPLAFAFGLQNSTARRMAIPDLTTTVLTLTVTGLAADSRFAGGPGARPVRRFTSIATMLAGAAAGALLVAVSVPLTITAAAGCAFTAAVLLVAARA